MSLNGNSGGTADWHRLNIKLETRNFAWLEAECMRRERQSRTPYPIYQLINEVVAAARAGRLPHQPKRRGRPRRDPAGV